MKKFLSIIMILIFATSMGCSNVNGKDTQTIKAPDNNNLKIEGIWSIEDIRILDDEIENKDEIMSLKLTLISISSNSLSILNKVYSNIKYKLKVVDKSYILSYELNLKIEDIVESDSKLDVISIIDSNTIIGEFILLDDENGYLFYNGILFKLNKKDDKPKEIDYSSNAVEAEIIPEDYDSDVGVMLALKTPRKKLDDGSFTEEKYKTLWISFKDNQLQPVIEKENIIFPRMNGIWSIKSEIIENDNQHLEYFIAEPLEGKEEVKLEEETHPQVYKNINFISNNYIAIEKYEGNNFQNKFPIYQTIPIDNINSKNGLSIEEIYSAQVKEKYEKDFNSTLDKLPEEKRSNLCSTIDYSNFTIKRIEGKWNLVGNIPSSNDNDDGINYRISLNPNKKILNYDTLLIPWKDLKGKFPFIKDAYTSPNGRIAVILFNNSLLVYEMEERSIKGSPLISIELNEDEEIIMAEWATGRYVDSWAKAFKDGKEISNEEE